MSHSRQDRNLSKSHEVTKNTGEIHPSSGSSTSDSQDALERTDGDLHILTSSFLREGSAADLRLCQTKKTSTLLANVDPGNLPDEISVVKKVMRVTPAYFRNFGSRRDESLLLNLHKHFDDRFQLWKSLDHPNLATLYFVAPKELTLFQEYCENGDLREYLKRNLLEVDLIRIIAEVLRGIVYLHNHNPPIAHGGINPGKIYMRGETAMLGEFGLSQLVTGCSHLVPSISVTGIARWMSPEYFGVSQTKTLKTQPGVFTTEGDMWSFGCTLFEIFTGALPYHQSKYDTQILTKIMDGSLPGNLESVSCEGLSPTSTQFVQHCITECWSPFGKRPSSQDLLEQVTPILTQLSQVLGEGWKPIISPPPISDTMYEELLEYYYEEEEEAEEEEEEEYAYYLEYYLEEEEEEQCQTKDGANEY